MSNEFGKIMVTGGAGFIGSHLTEELIKERKDVIFLDASKLLRLPKILLYLFIPSGGNILFLI